MKHSAVSILGPLHSKFISYDFGFFRTVKQPGLFECGVGRDDVVINDKRSRDGLVIEIQKDKASPDILDLGRIGFCDIAFKVGILRFTAARAEGMGKGLYDRSGSFR